MLRKKKPTRDHRGRTNKIIHNNWNAVEIDTTDINFVWSLPDTHNTINDLHYKMIMEEIHSVINNSKYNYVNDVNITFRADGSKKLKKAKIKKVIINEVFALVIEKTNFTYIEIFYTLSEYFDLDFVKFFDYLSNVYKAKIIRTLNKIRGKKQDILF